MRERLAWPRSWRACAALVATLALASVAPAPAASDPIEELRRAVLPFRGVGYTDVKSYRTELRLPDEESNGAVPLVEMWRAPADYGLRAAKKTEPAMVRSWAIFLEPLYVARASILDADLEKGAKRLRQVAKVKASAGDAGVRILEIVMPALPDTTLPGFLREASRFEAHVDAAGHLLSFHAELRPVQGRKPETLDLRCTWKDARAPQPSLCVWTLPDGGVVRVDTTFRDERGRRLPGTRHVVFPSRYDPGDTEEIRIEYGSYDFKIPSDSFQGKGAFRYDENGLVAD